MLTRNFPARRVDDEIDVARRNDFKNRYRLLTCSVLLVNFMKSSRTHEVLTASRLNNPFFEAQMVKQHQNFEHGLSLFTLQISRASAWWNNKTQERIKLHLPFNGKPPQKDRDNLGRSNRFKWRDLAAQARDV